MLHQAVPMHMQQGGALQEPHLPDAAATSFNNS
jgi:hypothetical protein